MHMWCRKIARYMLVLSLVATHFSAFTFAQEATNQNTAPMCTENHPICGASASQFAQYTEFAYKMLAIIQTVEDAGENLGQTVKPGLFQAGIVDPYRSLRFLKEIG